MPYAINDMISKSPLPGGVQITDERYAELLGGMCSGLLVKIENGAAVLAQKPVIEDVIEEGGGDAEAP